jgi:hypothetical protein
MSEEVASSLWERCLKANLLRLRDDLKEAERMALPTPSATPEEPGGMVTLAGMALSTSTRNAMFAFRAFWAEPALPLVMSALLLAVMSGGFLWRAMLRAVHENYATRLHDVSRGIVVQAAEQAWTVATQFPHSPPEDALRARILDRLGLPVEPAPQAGSHEALLTFLQGGASEVAGLEGAQA